MEQHSVSLLTPASLLLLPKSQPLRWVVIWCRRFAAFFDFAEISVLTVPSTSEQSPLCSDVFLCPGPKKTPSARFLAPPSQIEPVAPGLRFGFGCKTEGWHRSCCNVLKTVAWAGGCLSFWVPLPFVAHPSVFQCPGQMNCPCAKVFASGENACTALAAPPHLAMGFRWPTGLRRQKPF